MPEQMRIELAARAKIRRIKLCMTVEACAEAVGLKKENFAANERMLRKFPDLECEALWESVLSVPKGWLRDQSIPTPDLPKNAPPAFEPPADDFTSLTVSNEIRSVGAWLSRKSLLRRTAHISKLTPSEQRWADIFARRYGVLGDEASTLEAIGNIYGLTRERIRGITSVMVERADGLRISTPCLDSLTLEINQRAPLSIAVLDSDLREKLGDQLTIQSAHRFASEILGRKLANLTKSPFSKSQCDLVLEPDAPSDDFSAVCRSSRSVAMKMIRGAGAANIHFTCGAVSEEVNAAVSIEEVRTALSLVPGFEWLSEAEGWFWFGHGNGENRLQNVVKKIMAAAERKVDVDEIYASMGRSAPYWHRDSRPYSFDIPTSIIPKVLQRTPWLSSIQKNDFATNDPSLLFGVLSDVEVEIIKIIRSNSGVAFKHEIDTIVCDILQVTSMAVTTALIRSPCFQQPAHGLYSICGCDIDPHALFNTARRIEAQFNRQTITTADDNGFFRFDFTLTEYHVKHKFISIPIGLAKNLTPGKYALVSQDSPALVTRRGSGLTIFSKMMPRVSQLNVTPGAKLCLSINPLTMIANLDADADHLAN